MASELLVVPEDYIPRVISVIRQGLAVASRANGVKESAEADALLRQWCADEEAYLKQLEKEDAT